MKENILKNNKISKVNKESPDIIVNTTIRRGFEPNTIRYSEIKTDGVILSRSCNSGEKESKVIGASVTIVDNYYSTVSSGLCLRTILNNRQAYSEKWISEKDIERISERCHEGTISGFMRDNEIIIDGECRRLCIIDNNFEKIGLDGDSIIKSDGQMHEVDGRIYVRNASYIISACETMQPAGYISVAIYVDFNRACSKTLKDIRDDFRIASYEAKRKFNSNNII